MKKVLLSTMAFAFLFFSSTGFSQRICGTTQYNEELLQSNPAYAAMQASIEKTTQRFIENGGVSSLQNNVDAPIYTIPVVVHVVYNKNKQNISNAQIQSQLDVLNRDFQFSNLDKDLVPDAFKPLRADFQIKFCLATKDPNNNPTTGIIRKKTSKKSFSTNDNVKFSSKGGDDAWPAADYLNIWVCQLGGGVLGYATFPGGPASKDGVVILYSAFGDEGKVNPPYDKGRTATHEIGHWLNLRHIWGDRNCGTDYVDDTPTARTANYGCPSFPHLTCGNTTTGDMYMNYMDYVNDACMLMFSMGQKDRSFALFQPGGARFSVVNSGKCDNAFALAKDNANAQASPVKLNAVKFFPQPAQSFVNIQLNNQWKGNVSLTVINSFGAVVSVKQFNAESNLYRLDVSNFTSGIYYVSLRNNGETINQKIVIQH